MVSESATPGQVGQSASGEHGRPGHGQAAEPIDDPALEVLGQSDGGGHASDQYRFDEDRGHDVVDVGAAGDLDSPSQHVAEEEQQQGWLQGADQQQSWGSQDAEEIALGHPGGVAQCHR